MAKTVVGLFDERGDAEAAVRDLENIGFTRDQVSIVANNNTATADGTDSAATGDTVDAAATGAGTGAVAGTVIGGGVGLLAGLGMLAIPGIGPILAAGPIIATITGAGIGAATGAAAGGLIGALTEAGVPEEEAGYYQEGVRRGGTLVTVSTDDNRAENVVDVMNNHNVVDIDRRGQEYRSSGYTGGNTGSMTNTDRGYAGATTGTNTAAAGSGSTYSSNNADLTTGGNPAAASGNSGLGYTSGHNPDNDEEIGADADLSGAGAAVNHGYSGINTEPQTGGGYQTNATDRDIRYEGGSAGLNAGGDRAAGYGGQTAPGSPGGAYGGPNTGVPVNPNAGIGGSSITGQSAAAGAAGATNAGVTGTQRQPDYNESNAEELDRVAHEQRMPSRDDMSSTIPDSTVTDQPDSDEELGDTDRDLNRNRPGETNVY
jgi:hypothetical protein